jgi:hypothetical protein
MFRNQRCESPHIEAAIPQNPVVVEVLREKFTELGIAEVRQQTEP